MSEVNPKSNKKKNINRRFYSKEHAKALAALTGKERSDIRHYPLLEEVGTARRWIEDQKLDNWIAEEEDLDRDGTMEVIVKDDNGRKFAVNGYRLVPSHMPERRQYLKDHPTKEDRLRQSKRQYYNSPDFWNVGDFNEKTGIRTIAEKTPEMFEQWEKDNWGIPKKPSVMKSVYSLICKNVLNPKFKKVIDEKFEFDENTKNFRSILMPVSIFAKFYKYVILPTIKENIGDFNKLKNKANERENLMDQLENLFNDGNIDSGIDEAIKEFYIKLAKFLSDIGLIIGRNNRFNLSEVQNITDLKVFKYKLKQHVNDFIRDNDNDNLFSKN